MTIYNEYKEIYQTIQQLGYFLIKKLNKCEVEKTDNLSFDQLIIAIEEIKTKPYINNNNVKPTNKPELVVDKSLADFNKSLAERIVYYKKLIAYYLVLKGIPTDKVNACKTLAELINLIDKIEIVKKSYLTINVDEINESFGYAIPVPYTLQDRDGNSITEGSLTLEYEGATYFFTAGDEITFTPLNITESSTLKLAYHGSDNYYQHDPIYIDVKITPSKIKLNIDIENINYSSRYVNSHDTGYTDDTWQFTIETFNYKGIPLGNIDIELTSKNLNKTFKTDNNGKYTFTSKIEDSGQQILKFITQANSTEYTNTKVEYNIFIKYNMLSTSANITNYAGKTYTYNLEIHDEDTNQIDTSYDGQSINIVYENGDVTTETIQNGKISHSRTSLIAGEYLIGWIFYAEDFKTSTKTNLHILSNFILPEEDAFFLNTTPIIKYQPLGNTTINKEVEVSINGLVTVSVEAYDEDNNQIFEEDDDGNLIPVYTDEIQEQSIIPEGIIFKTDSNGILTDFANILDSGQYKVTLKSHSDDLNETISYDYELKKPFTVELSDYDKKDHAEFKLIIYDFNDLINYSATNGTNNIWDIRVEEEDTPTNIDEYISKTIRWYAMPSTIGTNTFTIEQNGYTETLEFKLYDRLFNFSEDGTLSTQITRTVGIANIQIACIDESVDSISITGTEILSIEKINDLFNVEILNRSTGLKTLLITDDSGAQEALTINIIKDNLTDYINANITLYDENVDNDTFAIINYLTEENEDITNMYNISFDIELPNDINGEIINFFFDTDSQNTPIAQQGSIINGICQIEYQQIPEGEYECRIEYGGNSTYSAYTKTFQVTIPKPKESEILEVEVQELNNLLLSFIIDKEIYSDLNTIYYKITNNNNTIDYCTFKYSTENEILTSLGEQSLSIPTTLLPDEACKFTFIFYGNDNYESFTKEITLKILKAQPTLEIDTYVGYDPTNYGSLTFVEIPSTAQINEEFTIAVQLLNHIKQPMPGETIKFWVNEELYETKQTNTSGICYVSYSLKDTSDLYIRCSSTNVVSESSIIKNVESLQLSTSLTDYSIDDEILFEAKCLNNDGELVNGVEVDFYVDDVYYDSAVSENGTANVSFVAEGTDIIYIKSKCNNCTSDVVPTFNTNNFTYVWHDFATENKRNENFSPVYYIEMSNTTANLNWENNEYIMKSTGSTEKAFQILPLSNMKNLTLIGDFKINSVSTSTSFGFGVQGSQRYGNTIDMRYNTFGGRTYTNNSWGEDLNTIPYSLIANRWYKLIMEVKDTTYDCIIIDKDTNQYLGKVSNNLLSQVQVDEQQYWLVIGWDTSRVVHIKNIVALKRN